jgi:hypothetical protein
VGSEITSAVAAGEAFPERSPTRYLEFEYLEREQRPHVSGRADKDGLWKQLDQLLQRRPGWRFQAIASPGAPPVWCFGAEGAFELSVTVSKDLICIYEVESDHEVRLEDIGELVAWLNIERPGSLQPQRGRVADKGRLGSFFKWE